MVPSLSSPRQLVPFGHNGAEDAGSARLTAGAAAPQNEKGDREAGRLWSGCRDSNPQTVPLATMHTPDRRRNLPVTNRAEKAVLASLKPNWDPSTRQRTQPTRRARDPERAQNQQYGSGPVCGRGSAGRIAAGTARALAAADDRHSTRDDTEGRLGGTGRATGRPRCLRF